MENENVNVEQKGEENAIQQEGQENQGQEKEQRQEVKPKKGAVDHYRSQFEAERKAREQLEAKLNDMKHDQLKQANRYEELYNLEKQAHEDTRSKYTGFKESYVRDKKLSSVQYYAARMGLRDEAKDDLENIGLDDVQIETTSLGNINVLGAKEYVEELKLRKPHWFNDGKPPVINNGRPEMIHTKKEITARELLDLQSKDKDAYYKANERIRRGELKIVRQT